MEEKKIRLQKALTTLIVDGIELMTSKYIEEEIMNQELINQLLQDDNYIEYIYDYLSFLDNFLLDLIAMDSEEYKILEPVLFYFTYHTEALEKVLYHIKRT